MPWCFASWNSLLHSVLWVASPVVSFQFRPVGLVKPAVVQPGLGNPPCGYVLSFLARTEYTVLADLPIYFAMVAFFCPSSAGQQSMPPQRVE